jgi:16S rRNA (cytosine967-C5)-methyltransferase
LNKPAPIDLRVNLLRINRPRAIAVLEKSSILCETTPYSKLGLRIIRKSSLRDLPLFKDGKVEIQDEGSQLLAQIVGVKRGETVVDFCAGAGGKTLALGAAMHDTGRLYAFDISKKRLAKLKSRVERSSLTNICPVLIENEKDYKIERLIGKIDRVLVDAPCSGLGTIRRNPDIQWRQTQGAVIRMSIRQAEILSSASRLVKYGGLLVYATCSILDEENKAVVEQFLASHEEFSLIPMKNILSEQRIELKMEAYLELWPHLHCTDGFFAAAFVRQ